MLFVATTHCEMCMLEFWNLHRCIKHVDRAAQYCANLYLLRDLPYIGNDVVRAEEVAEQHLQHMIAEGRRKTCAATWPAARAEGPLPRIASMRQR